MNGHQLPRPKVKWNWIFEEWEVRRGGKRWYMCKDRLEALHYAMLLAQYQTPDEYLEREPNG